MYRGSNPRVLPLIIIIVVVALVIAAAVTIGRMVLSGSSSTDKKDENTVATAVLDTKANRAVRWTVRGPIVANENFRSYQITVTPTTRDYTVYSGYLAQTLSNKSYTNNQAAYEQFVFALDNADIGNVRSADNTDIRGVCATGGLAYTFETVVENTADNLLWSSTCKGSPGTLAANPLQIQALFANQIPDFKPLFTNIY